MSPGSGSNPYNEAGNIPYGSARLDIQLPGPVALSCTYSPPRLCTTTFTITRDLSNAIMYYTVLCHMTLSLAGSFRTTCKDPITPLHLVPRILLPTTPPSRPQETHSKQRKVARAQTPAHRTPSGVNKPQFPAHPSVQRAMQSHTGTPPVQARDRIQSAVQRDRNAWKVLDLRSRRRYGAAHVV
jgi:hypothetical protein